MAVALGNLATVYLDEGRCLRAFALCLSASFFSSALSSDGQEWLLSIMRRADNRLQPGMSQRLTNIARDRGQSGTSLTELLWHLEDIEILYELERGRLGL